MIPRRKFIQASLLGSAAVLLDKKSIAGPYGLFNVYDLSYFSSAFLSVLAIMFLINAFNLIDGIDGLAGITGLIVHTSLGIMFAVMDQTSLACIAFAAAGACIGFLRYNLTPAKIFMGDTGSLLLGFLSIVLTIKFIELNKVGSMYPVHFASAPSIAAAILIGPVFDAIRVFSLRIIKKESPFVGDRNHVHHRILSLGFNHLQTSLILMSFNLLMIGIALLLRDIGNFILIGILFLICIIFNTILTFFVRSRSRKSFRLVNFLW